MTSEYLRLGMDSLILFFLVLTVYFAFRLSKNLTEFRSYRGELQSIMRTLGTQLERAQSVIQDIKDISQTSGQDIDDMMMKSRMASEELRAVNDASEALAGRLERLAGQSAEAGRIKNIDHITHNQSGGVHSDARDGKAVAAGSIQALLNDLKSELEDDDEVTSSGTTPSARDDIPDFLRAPREDKTEFTSETERDLYEALRKNRSGK